MNAISEMDENDKEIKSPMKRVGSTRKIIIFNNIRQQLNEQLRCLDVRVETHVALIQELQDYFRRRGEMEMEYSKNLDKLARSLLLRHKEQKPKRESWQIFSTMNCWQNLINQTQSLARDHATLSEICAVKIVQSLQTIIEDVQRLYKKCRAIGYEIHEEIFRVLQELHGTMKTYQKYENECKAAEVKLISAETQRFKLQQTIQKEKIERSKKYRLTEKEVFKRNTKYTDARLKALKAKKEYQLCLEASNKTIHKYFVEDLSDLIDCMDFGFDSMISRTILMYVTADQERARKLQQQAEELSLLIRAVDSRADKQKFLEHQHTSFMIPKPFEFHEPQEQLHNELAENEIQKALYLDMEQRLQLLEQKLINLRTESNEIWKTLETAELKLIEHFKTVNDNNNDISNLFTTEARMTTHHGFNKQQLQPEIVAKLKADKQDIENYYLSKIREYIKATSRIARLDAKADYLRKILSSDGTSYLAAHSKPVMAKRKRIGRINMSGQPKLFGGSLEEYLDCTGEEVPLIMRSCIRVINLYGLHHQGIFRVSGSQVEITNFRESFERGEDPLASTTDASDINSIAGVLKLYLRELREPLFPIIYFDYFMSIAELRTKEEIVLSLSKFFQSLPPSILVVMRYLFSFLNHLSEYADENMMDAYNLAICFGPTLMPAPEDKDQVQYQNQVNELIKYMIVYQEEIFPKELVGLEYEKYISNEQFIDIDVGDSPSDAFNEDPDSEIYPSEDESDVLEAMVQFDFNARSSRELTLRKGDSVILKKQVSNDWWQGVSNGKEGLIPDKYISLKMRDEDRDKTVLEDCNNTTDDINFMNTSDQTTNKFSLERSTDMILDSHDEHDDDNLNDYIGAVVLSEDGARNESGGILDAGGGDGNSLDTAGTHAHTDDSIGSIQSDIESTYKQPYDFTCNINEQQHQQKHNDDVAVVVHEHNLLDDNVSNLKNSFTYHSEPHSLENSIEYEKNYEKYEMLETTV